MITPRFTINQDEGWIILELYVPHIKISEVDFYSLDEEFKFHAKPYFLRLRFQQKLMNTFEEHPDEQEPRHKAQFDIQSGMLNVRLKKRNYGEHFHDLDILPKLLEKKAPSLIGAPVEEVKTRPSILETEQNSSSDEEDDDDDDDEEERNEFNEIEIEQKVNDLPLEELLISGRKYGFNRQYSNYFPPLQDEVHEFIGLSDPENDSAQEKTVQRLAQENAAFDPEHYLMDAEEDEEIQQILSQASKFEKILTEIDQSKKQIKLLNKQNLDPSSLVNTPSETRSLTKTQKTELLNRFLPFSDSQFLALTNLPFRQYSLKNEQETMCGLLDIVICFTYDLVSTFYEHTVESAWTISTLCATLCFLEQFYSVEHVVVSAARRMLCFPLYRHWDLILKVFHEASLALKLGRRQILKIFLNLKQIFDKSEVFHHFSKLFFDDYISFIQVTPESTFRQLNRQLTHVLAQLKMDDPRFFVNEIQQFIEENK